jgi:hypothetical protein
MCRQTREEYFPQAKGNHIKKKKGIKACNEVKKPWQLDTSSSCLYS